MTFTVQIVLFDGFDPLDAIAPFEVWDAGADAAGADIHLSFVSADGARLVTSGTREMPVAATGMLDPTLPGIIIVPGASGPVDGDPDEVNTVPVLLGRFAQSS
ncbi:MAG: transcriptional regulator containing an amidase domain and an AraC-type DNA-binding domain, partial [Alphaproteobacteria bacterium]|nr:transcriptional regulator containing an amidase domain and an AraC-type DNA-binding domain [Alphaproteobacteria bacterium]